MWAAKPDWKGCVKLCLHWDCFVFSSTLYFIRTCLSWLSCILPFCLYLDTQHKHPCLEPTTPASDRPQTSSLDRSASGISGIFCFKFSCTLFVLYLYSALCLDCPAFFLFVLEHTTQTAMSPAWFEPSTPATMCRRPSPYSARPLGSAGFNSRTVHPVASRSTDWAIPARYGITYLAEVCRSFSRTYCPVCRADECAWKTNCRRCCGNTDISWRDIREDGVFRSTSIYDCRLEFCRRSVLLQVACRTLCFCLLFLTPASRVSSNRFVTLFCRCSGIISKCFCVFHDVLLLVYQHIGLLL